MMAVQDRVAVLEAALQLDDSQMQKLELEAISNSCCMTVTSKCYSLAAFLRHCS